MSRRILGRGALIGPSELCYRVLGSPLNRNLFTVIAGFLADSSGAVTTDLYNLALSCGFLHFWTRTFRQVDTPSLANSPNTALSVDSSDFPPADVGYW